MKTKLTHIPVEAIYRGFYRIKYRGRYVSGPVVYYFDKDFQELGYVVQGFPFNGSTKGRPWGDKAKEDLIVETLL